MDNLGHNGLADGNGKQDLAEMASAPLPRARGGGLEHEMDHPSGSNVPMPGQEQWVLDEKMKKMLMDLQRHWLEDYQNSREKMLVEITEKVGEFMSDQIPSRTFSCIKSFWPISRRSAPTC